MNLSFLPRIATRVFAFLAAALFMAVFCIAGAIPAYASNASDQGVRAATLQAAADDSLEYSVEVDGFPYAPEQGIYGTPGEKTVLQAKTVATDEDLNRIEVKGVTYKWSAAAGLKATAKGAKLTVKKLPKVGKYSVQVAAYDKKGTKLATVKFKVVVRSKPGIKVDLRVQGAKASSVKSGAMMMLDMKNASFGWDNNTKKNFYEWSVKDLKTGKTAKWNAKNGTFKKNSFITGSSVGGGLNPVFMGSFSKPGKYKVTATLYHSNKKIDSATKTITVK